MKNIIVKKPLLSVGESISDENKSIIYLNDDINLSGNIEFSIKEKDIFIRSKKTKHQLLNVDDLIINSLNAQNKLMVCNVDTEDLYSTTRVKAL